MSFTGQALDTAAALARLTGARLAGRPCAPVRALLPDGDIGAAYAVQSAWVTAQLAAGDSVAGRKIGLTNPAVQAQLGVDQPDFGTLLASMDCPPDEVVDTGRLLQPRIEAEIAFVLARDLDLPDPTPQDVLAATGAVVAALEIVDSRVAGWDISIVDTVADNASSGLFTLGPDRVPPDGLDLASCPMRLWRGDQEVSAGSGAACLGHPAAAVAWLAVTARSYGQPLRAGEIVLSGALGPMVPVAAGDRFTADIGGLGQVTAVFRGSAR
jgi:2-keto-4-pentenoate hydratase